MRGVGDDVIGEAGEEGDEELGALGLHDDVAGLEYIGSDALQRGLEFGGWVELQ